MLGHGGNNFDLLRLVAAFLVLWSHAFVLAGRPDGEPLAPLLHHVTDGGGLAVGAFFVMSGWLIARSAHVHGWRAFVRARALRLYPAFAAAVLAQTLLLGPLASSLGAAGYLAAPATWDALARALVFSPRPGLPGVFEGNPLAGVVNGSLWTLRVEVACYAAMLGWAVLGARRGVVAAAVVAGFGALAAAHAGGAGLRWMAILDCMLFFATGAAAWCWREALPLRWWVLGVLAGGFALAGRTAAGPMLWHVVLPYAVLRLGLARVVLGGAMRRVGDISYGVYLYAFPLEQALVAAARELGVSLGPLSLAAGAAPVAALCGWASSRWIERPALRWKVRAG